jgi:Protein of unknown function (DUF2950)
MKPQPARTMLPVMLWAMGALTGAVLAVSTAAEPNPATKPSTAAAASASSSVGAPATFDSAEKAADALVDAAEKFDVPTLIKILGKQGEDLFLTDEYPVDRTSAQDFAAQARKKKQIATDPQSGNRAFLLVGEEDWPFALPIVKHQGRWSFDAAAGRDELIRRRIGYNELDAIAICHGYVDAQFEYSYRKRQGYQVAQYAQRIIASPGKQDGLAWKNADGTWGGPIGEKIASAIEQGFHSKADPYHGYFFKVLKGQGPDAPLGTLDYVVKGVMIGGFALVAAPAEYGVTGVKTFMVSNSGVVYQKDLGPATLDKFRTMERFNPDKTWTMVAE